ncbi:hypothetical protein [Pseudomonas veronii]|uniref:Uncharacterized protein n=1 Tax=Pseudomonas veronii TaxID=76761 RepID=A0A5M8EZ80_PSEVE|nr:hypothetical protein [Pseudomonas veronii]KAA6170063.1 hypothetical protein F3K54_25055 [Pseudomonas veronii]KAA6176690.1 hypothetical protein F3K53_18030 [Pseudomonas veronii]
MTVKSAKQVIVSGWETPNLEAPNFPQALEDGKGLVWRPFLDRDGGLVLECPIWRFPDEGDEMQVEFSPAGVSSWTPLDPIFFPTEPSGPHVEVTVSINLLGHGEFDLRFKVRPGSGGDYSDFSKAQRVKIDLYGPYKSPGKSEAPARGVYPASLPQGADITQETLDLNPSGFELGIPAYGDWEAGDTVSDVWFTSELPPDDSPSLGSFPMPSGGTDFNLPITFFDTAVDGIFFWFYRLRDAAGNYSEISKVPTGRRLRRSANLILAPLKVVSPADSTLVDIDAWTAGVQLAIPLYTWDPSDQYILVWGSQETTPAPLNGVFDFVFTAPPQLIIDEYGSQEGPIETALSYIILRTGSKNRPDDETLVDVDLSKAGPVTPLPGDPSPDLDQVTIQGPASFPARENYLNSADIDHVDAILAVFDLWSVTPAPVEGDVITLYWGSRLNIAGTHTIALGEGAGTPITIVVDKAAIAAAGNGPAIDVFYGVRNPASTNSNFSESTPVEVDGAITHTMDAAEFLNTLPWSGDTRGRITCASLRPTGTPGRDQYIEVKIPPNAEFFADKVVVTIEYVASTGLAGDQPIEPTRGTSSVTLDPTTAANGFIFHLQPFDPHLKVVGAAPPYNSVWLQYSLDVSGTPARSVPAVIPARMVTANNYCDGSDAAP